MKATLLKFASPFLFVMLTAVGGTAVAATGSEMAQATPDGPVDCKKTPEHPRCKDKKK